MTAQARLPSSADVVVVGSGSAGAPVAGLIAAGSEARVRLLEAGPDYGPRDSGRWPADLLDAAIQPTASHDAESGSWKLEASHDWGYVGQVHGHSVAFSRATLSCDPRLDATSCHGAPLDAPPP